MKITIKKDGYIEVDGQGHTFIEPVDNEPWIDISHEDETIQTKYIIKFFHINYGKDYQWKKTWWDKLLWFFSSLKKKRMKVIEWKDGSGTSSLK